MNMKTGRTKRKIARRLGLPIPSKDGARSLRQRMRAYTLIAPATIRPWTSAPGGGSARDETRRPPSQP